MRIQFARLRNFLDYSFGQSRPVPLDISKPFDGVWHAARLHKFKVNSISGRIFDLMQSFLRDCVMKVVLNGIVYSWHMWFGASAIYLQVLENIQRRASNVIGTDLVSRFQALPPVFCIKMFHVSFFLPEPREIKRTVRLATGFQHLAVGIGRRNSTSSILIVYFPTFVIC